MKKYSEIIFEIPDPGQRELLMAELTVLGFDGFEEEGQLLKAYIDEAGLDIHALNELCKQKEVACRVNTIEEKNWNAEWESSFSPVLVDDYVSVRAHFHPLAEGSKHDIVITPKMSFGTGHHATTWLMMQGMRNINFTGKNVLDFGTGTGVLAILAEKEGAGDVLAIDNDEWSVANATENVERNRCQHIRIQLSDTVPAGEGFDVILANINKHILLASCEQVCKGLKPGGSLLLSGILREDRDDIVKAYGELLGAPVSVTEKNNWLMISFKR